MNNVAESAFSEMFRVISEFKFLGRAVQECEASLCPPGDPGQHVHGPSRGSSDMGRHVRAKSPTGLTHSQCPPGGLEVWSDTLTPSTCWPGTSGPPTLGMCSPSPRTKANRHLWGLLEAFPEKGCVYSMGTAT